MSPIGRLENHIFVLDPKMLFTALSNHFITYLPAPPTSTLKRPLRFHEKGVEWRHLFFKESLAVFPTKNPLEAGGRTLN